LLNAAALRCLNQLNILLQERIEQFIGRRALSLRTIGEEDD
jgi:NAD-dependent DNA ligase